MHVLHIDLGRELRGGQHQVLLLLKTLREAGHSSTLLARARSPLFESARQLGINAQPASLLRLRRLSIEHDMLHAHDARAHTWAALVSQRPFVVSRRVAFPVRSSPLSKFKYRRAARFLAVSKFVGSRLCDAGVALSKIDVVYDAVEPATMQIWSADSPVIALASKDPKKGRDLVERVAEIASVPIVFSNDLAKDLARASVFVYISRSEGFGSAALLAMSQGVPVIASRIDGMVEVLEDGISGLAVANEPAAIAAAIRRVRADAALANALIAGARQRVEDLFTPASLLINTLASYRRALAV